MIDVKVVVGSRFVNVAAYVAHLNLNGGLRAGADCSCFDLKKLLPLIRRFAQFVSEANDETYASKGALKHYAQKYKSTRMEVQWIQKIVECMKNPHAHTIVAFIAGIDIDPISLYRFFIDITVIDEIIMGEANASRGLISLSLSYLIKQSFYNSSYMFKQTLEGRESYVNMANNWGRIKSEYSEWAMSHYVARFMIAAFSTSALHKYNPKWEIIDFDGDSAGKGNPQILCSNSQARTQDTLRKYPDLSAILSQKL